MLNHPNVRNLTSQACPVWEEIPNEEDLKGDRNIYNSFRAGGQFQLKRDAISHIQNLRDLQKANLSYWIYDHNLRFGLFARPLGHEDALVLNHNWIVAHSRRKPSAEERFLSFLGELIRQRDLNLGDKIEKYEFNNDLLKAASGVRSNNEYLELTTYATKLGFIHSDKGVITGVDLSARIYVESNEGNRRQTRQGFVAMWFDEKMGNVFEEGFAPAIEEAGYSPCRIDKIDFLGKVDDQIIAEIRRSNFVVADFTCVKGFDMKGCTVGLSRGGVYFEAGFAKGLGLPVIFTCRKDSIDYVHFDTDHFNHLIWETSKDLRCKLKKRIEATLGEGPVI